MKTRRKISMDEKRSAVYDYHCTLSKMELASKIISLMYEKDIKNEYKQLPKRFKV